MFPGRSGGLTPGFQIWIYIRLYANILSRLSPPLFLTYSAQFKTWSPECTVMSMNYGIYPGNCTEYGIGKKAPLVVPDHLSQARIPTEVLSMFK